jgi:hypothetical protein
MVGKGAEADMEMAVAALANVGLMPPPLMLPPLMPPPLMPPPLMLPPLMHDCATDPDSNMSAAADVVCAIGIAARGST